MFLAGASITSDSDSSLEERFFGPAFVAFAVHYTPPPRSIRTDRAGDFCDCPLRPARLGGDQCGASGWKGPDLGGTHGVYGLVGGELGAGESRIGWRNPGSSGVMTKGVPLSRVQGHIAGSSLPGIGQRVRELIRVGGPVVVPRAGVHTQGGRITSSHGPRSATNALDNHVIVSGKILDFECSPVP